MSKNAQIVRFDPHQDHHHLDGLVECYQNVFAGSPWNEWMKCPKCEKCWGTKDKPELQRMEFRHCETNLVQFWPAEQVRKDILHEVTPESSCWIALYNNKVVGFCWGYPIEVSELERKLKIGFSNDLQRQFGSAYTVFYQDEMGVDPSYQGQGIASAMFDRRLEDLLGRGMTIGVVRTRERPEPSVTHGWFMEMGYPVIARYPNKSNHEEDGRVIMAANLIEIAKKRGVRHPTYKRALRL